MPQKNNVINRIKESLAASIDQHLLDDLLKEFALIKQDYMTGVLGRASPGKFVETVVQIMQYLENGRYENQPTVDSYLRDIENRSTTLPDHIKLLVSRIARSIYSLRNKRGIGHKGEVDPNMMDLKYILNASQWILAEFVRVYYVTQPDEAAKLIEAINVTPSVIIEDFGRFKTVLERNITPTHELLIVLHSYYPSSISRKQISDDMKRRCVRVISHAIGLLFRRAWIENPVGDEYKLTSLGYEKAVEVISRLLNKKA